MQHCIKPAVFTAKSHTVACGVCGGNRVEKLTPAKILAAYNVHCSVNVCYKRGIFTFEISWCDCDFVCPAGRLLMS